MGTNSAPKKVMGEAANDAALVQVRLGHLLPGGALVPASDKGINETYRGLVEVNGSRLPAYVKFLSAREVFNEVLGSILCQFAGLKTPDCYLVRVERVDYPASPFMAAQTGNHIVAFGTHAMPFNTLIRHASLTSQDAIRELLAKWKDWPAVLVFDQWIANPDRHAGNFLVGVPGEMHLIDHGLSFGGASWKPSELAACVGAVTTRLWNDTLQHVIGLPERIEATATVQATAIKLASINTENAISMTQVNTVLTSAHIDALLHFLTQRCTQASAVVCTVMGVPSLPFGGPL